MRAIEMIIVHCAATPARLDIGAAEIRRWHTTPKPDGRGWRDIGYHYVIRRDGEVETGRPLEQSGAHAYGFNARSIGVCLVGGVDGGGRAQNNFNGEQFAALHDLIAMLEQRFGRLDIRGHRDLPRVRKDCPSFDVRAWLVQTGLREMA